jgi:class 3 adenylate cyclase/tetratricopeptide (TPR) repeat protein
MFTDIVGYSSMTQKDELLTLELLQEHRNLVRPSLSKHGGKEIDTIGDAFLVEFSDPTEAVRCASEIQQLLHQRNLRSEPSRRLSIRVGIHAGDVIHLDGGEDVYGNCVNIASRIEPLADPGGICVTRQVYDLTKGSLDLEFENLGEHDLKNIEVPLGIFKVVLPWEAKEPGRVPELRRQTDMQASPFVGRDAERAQLGAILDQSFAGQYTGPKLILVGGEAGIGKTRLIDWFLGEAMQRGASVARGYCQADVSIPYFPISEALGKFLTDKQQGAHAGSISFSNWLRTFAKSDLGYDPGSSRNQMFEATARLIRRLSERGLLVVSLEDIHWADTGTLALLHYLARNAGAMNVLLVCTYRAEDLAGGQTGELHPLKETMLLMSREGVCRSIELGRLAGDSIREIVAPILGTPSSEVAGLLAKESEGNPLFAVEYARLLKGEGKGTAVKEAALTGMPESVQSIITRRVDALGDDDRRLLDCASVMGERFEPLVLADGLGLDRLAALERLDRITRGTRILREEVEGSEVVTFRFDHAKIREVILGGMTSSLRRELHRRVAEATYKNHQDERAEELAFHYREAKMPRESSRFSLMAGDRARLRFANSEATVYYGWALEQAPPEEEGAGLRVKALIRRANAYFGLALNRKALADAQAVLKGSTDHLLRLQAIRICAESCFDIGSFTESLAYCNSEETESRAQEGAAERLRIGVTKARITGYRGDPASAIESLERIGPEARAQGDISLYANVLLSLKEFQLTVLDLDGATKSALEALAIFKEQGDPEGEMSVSQSLGGNSLFMGEIKDADGYYARAAELGDKLGQHGTLVWLYLYWGLAHESIGDYDEALKLSLKALENARLSEIPYGETAVLANLTRGYIRAGRMQDAEDAYSRMNVEFEEHAKDASVTLRAAVLRTRGFYLASFRKFDKADKEYASSLELLRNAILGPFHEAETRVEYAGFLLSQGRMEEAGNQLRAAKSIYSKVGNGPGLSRIEALASSSGLA